MVVMCLRHSCGPGCQTLQNHLACTTDAIMHMHVVCYSLIHVHVLHCSIAYSCQVHATNITITQISRLLNKAVPHEKLFIQCLLWQSTSFSGVGRRTEAAWASIVKWLVLAQKHCLQFAPLFSLVSSHPLPPCSAHNTIVHWSAYKECTIRYTHVHVDLHECIYSLHTVHAVHTVQLLSLIAWSAR